MTTRSRVAIVTGAARGIGHMVAERLAKGGAAVVMTDVLKEVKSAADRLKVRGHATESMLADVADEAGVRSLVTKVFERHGRIDILVNNAGISPKHDGRKATVTAMTLEEWESVLKVNLTGTFLMSRACVPIMREAGFGRIVNISSQAGRTFSDIPGAHYAATKAGIIGFSRILAGEVGSDGITVNSIAPGRISTPMADAVGEDVNSAIVSRIPVRRIGTPQDIAATVAFLVSEEASFITGATIDVNGGAFMG
jgi:3-oxoacyl-[acyl-carrier protein] reductase